MSEEDQWNRIQGIHEEAIEAKRQNRGREIDGMLEGADH